MPFLLFSTKQFSTKMVVISKFQMVQMRKAKKKKAGEMADWWLAWVFFEIQVYALS